MALQVWLPLNKEGDFQNKGLADITVTNNGAAYDTNGKIGGCYKFIDNTTYLCINKLTNWKTFLQGKSYSICTWIKADYENRSNRGFVVITNGIRCFLDDTGKACFHLYNTTRSVYISSISIVADSKWHHIVCSYNIDSNIMSLYVDGVLEESKFYHNTEKYETSQDNRCEIGHDFNNKKYYLNGSLNDVRIYDHCLSPKEVKEISKGLVLHYPLNPTTYDGPNLITSLQAGGQTTVNNTLGTVTTSGVNSDTYFILNTSEVIVDGQTYTIECYAENIPEDKYWTFSIRPIEHVSSSNIQFRIHNGYNSYTFIVSRAPNDNFTQSTNIMLDDINRNNVWQNKAVFSNWKLYKNNKVSDCSGYCNNGTITGNLTTSNDTPRYDKCTVFNTNQTITITDTNTYTADQITVSFQIKCNQEFNSTQFNIGNFNGGIFIRKDTSSYYHLLLGWAGYTDSGEVQGGGRNVVKSIQLNHQYFVTYIFNKGKITIYLDGVSTGTEDRSTKYTKIKINASKKIGNFDGCMSDFRIYSTALSDEDIKELYNTSVLIDNQYNLFAYSFNETSENNISKSGILNSNQFIEDSNTEIYEDKTKANQIIEI